jgi:hypothetical protein
MLRSNALRTHSHIARNPPHHPSLRPARARAPVRSDSLPWGLLAHEGRAVQFDADVFVYDSGREIDDLDYITDFRPGVDKIDLSRTDKFGGTDFDELLASTNQINGDTVIDMGRGSLTLEGIDVEDLDADDFIF